MKLAEKFILILKDTTHIFRAQNTLLKSLNKSLPDHLETEKLTEVYYYGAGCSTDAKRKIVADAMKQVFPNAEINIGHDFLASCRALTWR